MNQDCSREESKPPLFARLGEFSKLPPELRFQIWNCLFDDFLWNTSSTPCGLSIISCNRYLNEETTRILYERRVLSLTIVIRCSPEGGRIPEFHAIVKAAKGAGKLMGVKFMGLSYLDDVLRLVRNFPSWRFQKCGPWIHVNYFCLLCPSEELELWDCVVRVVDTLKLIPNGKNITFNTFYPYPLLREQTVGLTRSGVIKDWFDERFPGQPVPFRSRHRPDIRDHGYPPGPCLIIPVYHYTVLQAMRSAELKRHERDKLEVEL
ncbi:hypothetical protein CBS147339_1319 [Penicillium roqueforti]|uniref:Genomic scaffold, ProqFM164S02 n=1 Tax=Penicillium roqueforti (strain FM164) TaxID=1365484 RepID=W6Q5S9_PENRF|nr:hypothetical protein CBS147339_1319 [Penicillium roqueforti]KAI3153984.1 hypothetical protein CBS147325_1076 [Penicillium roqueforti]KAI3175733.1 hypothetical protein DTO046C5_2416 [Penicillium roqueforti]KAI3191537.1 hypothetical protein DTO032C6_1267 [Penicillium roqueforti]CDM32048.1 unnamed protein product [Penicillium roqueforti FM164]